MSQALTTTDTASFNPGTGLVPRNMDEALRLAEFMSRARTMPKHLLDSPGDCLMVVELAMRWGMSPFAVAQGTSVISGKLMIEGKLVAAAVEASGAITGHIDYAFTGEGETRSILVSATRRGETNPRIIEVKLKEARTNNEMWKRQPDQQLCYHGVRVWARRWTPAVILGVYSREEMGPIIDGTAEEQPPPDPRLSQMSLAEVDAGRQALNAQIPLKPTRRAGTWRSAEGEDADRAEAAERERAAAAATPRAPRKADAMVYETGIDADDMPDPLDETDGRQWLLNLDVALANAQSQEEVVAIGGHASVGHATANAPEHVKRRVSELLAKAFARFAPDGDADLDEVVIAGQEKMEAG